ncbi:uncharacterized protein EAF01_010485 [Botrytis porri]|uniref:VOC domain-containing protein n=1 Tax=Botrytis porri TaxID=87229 RepID=A0A4Z1L2Q5_9HELO|nr:uncharacterized protein EAF01_010485 [Botrytis porri]KAF7892405.1 hypothetical protein EAF01_010485 [Botrytis porri]TGO91122.1 hypothetical protein BPOR_0038g00080 [Botrytis porri]
MSLYHISLPCTNLKASEEFYATVLKPLGYKTYLQTRNKTFFRPSWSFHPELSLRRDRSYGPIGGTRITIHTSSRSQVDKFYVLGLAKSNNIQSGEINDYPNAYTASIVDFDSNVIEAIYLKSWVTKVIIPFPMTPAAICGAPYLVVASSIFKGLGEWYYFIFNTIWILIVAGLIYVQLDSERSTQRLEDSGQLSLEKRDKTSRARLASRDVD